MTYSWIASLTAFGPLVEDPARTEGVSGLGVDETAFLAANHAHHTLFVTGFVDLDSGRLLDVVANRCGASVSGWLARQDQSWRDGIDVLALDPHRGPPHQPQECRAQRTSTSFGGASTEQWPAQAVKVCTHEAGSVRQRRRRRLVGAEPRLGTGLGPRSKGLLAAGVAGLSRSRPEVLRGGVRREVVPPLVELRWRSS